MNDSVFRSRAGFLQQLCGWVIAAAYLLTLAAIIQAYVDLQAFQEYRDIKNIIVCGLEVLSFGALIFLVGNRAMKLGFGLLILGVLTSLLNDVSIIGESRNAMIALDMLQWLLMFSGLVAVCTGGDLIRRFPRIAAAYLFFIGSSAVVILTYVAVGDCNLFWYSKRNELFIWIDAIYCAGRCVAAILFWIAVLRVNYPDDGMPVVSRRSCTAVIAFIAATAASGVILKFILPLMP